MEISERIHTYLSVLEIRQRSRRWYVLFLGGIFIVSILVTLAVGLLVGLTGRSVYLITGINIVFAFSCLMAWVRFEFVQSSIEMLKNLQR